MVKALILLDVYLQSNKRINSLLARVIAQANAAHNPAIIPTALTENNNKTSYFSVILTFHEISRKIEKWLHIIVTQIIST